MATLLSNEKIPVSQGQNGINNNNTSNPPDRNIVPKNKEGYKNSEPKTSKIFPDLEKNDAIKLKREIGLLEAVAITVGSIIGSGKKGSETFHKRI